MKTQEQQAWTDTLHCIKCDAPVEDGAKYCQECGTAVHTAPKSGWKPIPLKLSLAWLVVLGIGTIGIYSALFIPPFQGRPPDPEGGWPTVAWTALLFYLWRRRVGKGRQGAWIGAVVGFSLFFLVGVIAAIIRH